MKSRPPRRNTATPRTEFRPPAALSARPGGAYPARTISSPHSSPTAASPSSPGDARRSPDADDLRQAMAALLGFPQTGAVQTIHYHRNRRLRAEAQREAARRAAADDLQLEASGQIGCRSETEAPLDRAAEERVLCELYAELSRLRPSPTRLWQLSVQYACDPRQPITAALSQFDVRPVSNGFQITVSPPRDGQAVPLPTWSRIVRNPDARRLLQAVRQTPTPYFQLMELIETLLGRVPSLPVVAAAEPPAPPPLLTVDLEQQIVWLAGRPYPVSLEQAHFVQLLNQVPGAWITTSDYRRNEVLRHTPRVDHVYKRLPSPIRAFIESKTGTGYRLVLERLAELRQNLSVVMSAPSTENHAECDTTNS